METHEKNLKEFEIRMYLKADLAQLYCPNHSPILALQNLKRWMRKCTPLMAELAAAGYDKRRHWFLKKEVHIIWKYLGDPF